MRLLTISEDTTAFPWMKRTPGYGLLAMPAMIVALAVGRMTGHAAAGAVAAGSAFTVDGGGAEAASGIRTIEGL